MSKEVGIDFSAFEANSKDEDSICSENIKEPVSIHFMAYYHNIDLLIDEIADKVSKENDVEVIKRHLLFLREKIAENEIVDSIQDQLDYLQMQKDYFSDDDDFEDNDDLLC